jgi:hypothetical protein
MAAPYYTPTGQPITSSSGSSAVMRTEFTGIETAFDLFPALTANGIFQVNPGGTGVLAQTQLTLYDDLNFSVANPEIRGSDTNGILYITAGTTNILGGSIRLYGDTHSTKPNDIEIYGAATLQLQYDDSGSLFDFQDNAITTTGAASSATITTTGLASLATITTTGLATLESLKLGPGATITDIIESDTMAGATDTNISSSLAIKTYVDSQASAAGAYSPWLIKTTTFTAASGDQLICNHATTPFTITLPASPSAGDTVIISNAGAALVTIGRNSSNINSAAADGTLPTGNSTQLVYVDATVGWFEV